MRLTPFIRRFGALAGMAAILLFLAVSLPDTFLTPRNLLNVSQQISMLAVIAATMTVVMLMGDFDLSVGSMASLCGVLAAVLFMQGWSIPAALAAAVAVGLMAGLTYASRVASANPTQGSGLMLSGIAAVFPGMTLTQNNQPRVLATLAGVVFLGLLDNGLTQVRVDSYVREVLVGLIILLAVGLGALGRRPG
jgi:ribose/xylose/arabinose/galactoside ABC-type transport system permease subunit